MQKPVIRPYTPVSDVDQKGTVDFIIKKYPNGPMSEHLHNMEPGQRLEIKGPIPKYQWTPNKHEHVAMIAGGTGIAPMWQVARAIFKSASGPPLSRIHQLILSRPRGQDQGHPRLRQHLRAGYTAEART